MNDQKIALFWSNVNRDGPVPDHVPEIGQCWEWTGRRMNGYGFFGTSAAHRVSVELDRGPIPDGMFVCHRCDNPACVRPDQLFVGTPADNVADMISKGRPHGRPMLPDWTARRGRLSLRITMSRQDLDVLDRLAAVLELGRVPTIRLALDRLATSEAVHPRTEPSPGD